MPFLLEKHSVLIKNLFKNEKKFFWFFGALIIFISLTRYLAHSEFWSIFYSKYLFQPGDLHDSLYSKIIFHSSLFWIHWLPVGNLAHLILARLISALVACGILFTTFKIFRLKFSSQASIFLICILYFNHLVFWELPQLKADIFSLFFLLLAFYYFELSRKKIAIVFVVLSLLCTPKAILFIPFLLLYFGRQMTISFTFSFSFRKRLWLIRGLLLLPVAYFGIQSLFLLQWPKISFGQTYVLAFRYAKDLLSAGLASISNQLYYHYPIHVLIYWIPAVLLVTILLINKNLISITKKNLTLITIIGTYVVLIVALYPLKHPYFLIPILFLMTIICLFVFEYTPRVKNFLFQGPFIFILIFHFILNFYQICRYTYMNHGFSQQLLLLRLDQIALENPQATIADSIGALPQSNVLPLFFGLYDSPGHIHAEKFLKRSSPDLIFFTSKMSMSGAAHDLVNNEYVPIAPSIFAKQVPLPNEVLLDTRLIIKNLEKAFKFPIHTVSFRIYESRNINSVIDATCATDFFTKNDWSISEFEKCPHIVFKFIPQDTSGEPHQVYIVPWPAYEKSWPQSLARQLNYKNN